MPPTNEDAQIPTDLPWALPEKAVVVGVDGSRRNWAAAEWAAATAVATGRPLTLLHVVDESAIPVPFHPPETDDTLGRRLLVRVESKVRRSHPDAEVRQELAFGRVAASLVSHSSPQWALVVGRRGHGTFLRLLVGSTVVQVAARARVPVVVVPQHWSGAQHRGEPVVVGVDHRDVQHQVLLHAFSEARRLGVALIAAHGREMPSRDWDLTPAEMVTEPAARASPDDALALVLEPFRDLFPDVEVELLHRNGHPLSVLLDETGPAQQLVLGRHGTRARPGIFPFGSVAQAVLPYAEIPVTIVPPLV